MPHDVLPWLAGAAGHRLDRMDASPHAAGPGAVDPYAVTAADQLAALYDPPREIVLRKVADRLGERSRSFIAASPFCVLATIGPGGPRCTPRGDAPGFVAVLDERTLALPDRRGNNRLDGLRDILADPRVALLFMVPGSGETLRVHGLARITADPALRARHAVDGKLPATVVLVSVTEVYVHCSKALTRSGLWAGRQRPAEVPGMGALLAEHTSGAVEPAAYEAEYQVRVAATLY